MARLSATIVVTFAWWLRPYLFGVMTMVRLTGCEPDYDKVEKKIRQAVRLRVVLPNAP